MPHYRIDVLAASNHDEGEVAWRVEQALYRIPGLDQLDLTVYEAVPDTWEVDDVERNRR